MSLRFVSAIRGLWPLSHHVTDQIGASAPRISAAIEYSAAVLSSRIVGSSIGTPVPRQDPGSLCLAISLRERSGLLSVVRALRMVGHSIWERPSPALEVRHPNQMAPLREEHLVSGRRRRSSRLSGASSVLLRRVEDGGFRFSQNYLAQSRAPESLYGRDPSSGAVLVRPLRKGLISLRERSEYAPVASVVLLVS